MSLLSFLLPVAKRLHMSILTTVITMKTSTLTMSNRWSNRRRSQWHGSSTMSNRKTCSQDRRNMQEIDIPKMSLLITNLIKSIHQGDTGVTSKQLSMKRFKLITNPSQEVIGASKLKGNLLILA
jgi:hypothetical protein